MTNNSPTADEIERDIAGERAALSDTINDLQDKFSVNTIVSDINDMVRTQGGDLGRTISDTIARNPTAVVMTTVGLAWLFLGQGRNKSAKARTKSDTDWYDNSRKSKHGDFGGQDAQNPTTPENVMEKIRASAARVGVAASDLTERLSHGIEDLSEEAKSRVLAARHAAFEARQTSQETLRKGRQAASGLFDDQPLVVGALAVAAGAAIGGLLPHTKVEDETMGAARDDLYAKAQQIYREERAKAIAAAKIAASDVKDEIKNVGADLEGLLPEDKNIGEVIADRTADAAKRVIGHASEAAGGKAKGDTQA